MYTFSFFFVEQDVGMLLLLVLLLLVMEAVQKGFRTAVAIAALLATIETWWCK